MTIDVTDPVLSMQLAAARVASARRELASSTMSMRASLRGDEEVAARAHYRYDTGTRRILEALERLENALDEAALAEPFVAGRRPSPALR